jgi:hypothetical protein
MNSTINFVSSSGEMSIFKRLLLIISYVPLLLIAMGVLGNLISFLIFTFDKKIKEINCMVYLSFVSITDTMSLFVWNLNHFLKPNFQIEIEYLTHFNCKFFTFLQYFSMQSSALLLSILTIDRFVTVATLPGSFLQKLPFRSRKNALIWSWSIIISVFIMNSHILILNGVYVSASNTSQILLNESLYKNNSSNQVAQRLICYLYPNGFKLFPEWENIQLITYCLIPFLIMTTFNILLLFKSIINRKTLSSTKSKTDKNIRQITISLIVISMNFLLMTLPANIAFGYFHKILLKTDHGNFILHFLDIFLFFNHSSLFITCYITNIHYKKVIKIYLKKFFCIFRKAQ